VDELVGQDVLELGVAAGEGQQDSIAQRLRDAARRLADMSVEDVRALKVGLRCVENDRLAPLELVVEQPAQAAVDPLGHARGVIGRRALFRVEIDVEVGGLDDLEVARLILDLVAAERRLAGGGHRHRRGEASRHGADQQGATRDGARRMNAHVDPGAASSSRMSGASPHSSSRR
jgi:hypothetical protein